jgi:hypothetical protein
LVSGFNPGTLAPFFHNLWTALGLNPPPLATPAPETDPTPLIAALEQKPLKGDVKLDSIPQGSEGEENGPNTGVQQNVDPTNVLASSVTGGPSNGAGGLDSVSKTVVLDVGKPTLTPTSLRNGLSIADGFLAGPAEPPKTSTESTGKADGNGVNSSSRGTESSGGTESGSPRHAKQGETGPRHAKAGNDNDSSGGGGQHRADAH